MVPGGCLWDCHSLLYSGKRGNSMGGKEEGEV